MKKGSKSSKVSTTPTATTTAKTPTKFQSKSIGKSDAEKFKAVETEINHLNNVETAFTGVLPEGVRKRRKNLSKRERTQAKEQAKEQA